MNRIPKALLMTGIAVMLLLPTNVGADPTPLITTLENEGVGSGFDTVPGRSKFFENVPVGAVTSVITSVCAYTAASSGTVDFALAVSPYEPAKATGTIVAGAETGYSCIPTVIPWTDSTLFLHRTGGDAEVAFAYVPAGEGDSYWDIGYWYYESEITRGYRVTVAAVEL